MKKILHVINARKVGGVERLFQCYLENTHNDGLTENHVLCNRNVIDPSIKPTLLRCARSLRFVKFFGKFKLFSWNDWHLKRTIRKLSPDVIVLWNVYSAVSPVLKTLAREFPFIWYDHGMSWDRRGEKYKAVLDEMALCVACSHASMRMLQLRWKMPRVIMVKNAVISSLVCDEFVKKSIVPGEMVKLGIAARLTPFKGHCILLHALARLRKNKINATLLIAGKGSEEPRLKALARQLGIEEHVSFLGFVKDMKAFYNDIHFLVAPSLAEAFGLVVVEAMLFGCVPIVSIVDDLNKIVKHGVTGYCVKPSLELPELERLGQDIVDLPAFVYDPEADQLIKPRGVDPKDFASAIQKAIEQPDVYASMSQKAALEAKSSFGFERYVKELRDVFCSVSQ